MPYMSAALTAMTFHVLHSQMFRTGVLPVRITIAAVAGFALGGHGAGCIGGSMIPMREDKEIMQAFEWKFVQRSLNLAGYNNNAISTKHNATYWGQGKPY